MCNLDKLKVARKPLPLPPPFDKLWQNVHKIIDVFHFPNHVGTECKELYNPKHFKEKHPSYNTQAGEQSFAWISRFKHILCAMPKNHHLFYLHRMVLRRNSYTTRCYQSGRKPILPKKRWMTILNCFSCFFPCNQSNNNYWTFDLRVDICLLVGDTMVKLLCTHRARIGFWRGAGEAKAFVPLTNFTLKFTKFIRAPVQLPSYAGFMVKVTQLSGTITLEG